MAWICAGKSLRFRMPNREFGAAIELTRAHLDSLRPSLEASMTVHQIRLEIASLNTRILNIQRAIRRTKSAADIDAVAVGQRAEVRTLLHLRGLKEEMLGRLEWRSLISAKGPVDGRCGKQRIV
jgi:hypothetical protein